jgi:adenine-specific DNA-methyltransferase
LTPQRPLTMPAVHQIWQGNSIELCKRFKWVDCIITDPPFGVDNQSNMAVTDHGKAHATKIANDETPEQAIEVYQAVMSVLLPKLVDNADCYVFTSHQVVKEWLVMLDDFMPRFGLQRKAILYWEKEGPGMGDLECPWGMGGEFIMFFQKGRREKTGTRRNSIIRGPQIRPDKLIHPHEKPSWLLELLMKQSTVMGDFLVDPFGGSGSLALAARNIGRNAVSIELEEDRARVAQQRFESTIAGFDFGE